MFTESGAPEEYCKNGQNAAIKWLAFAPSTNSKQSGNAVWCLTRFFVCGCFYKIPAEQTTSQNSRELEVYGNECEEYEAESVIDTDKNDARAEGKYG